MITHPRELTFIYDSEKTKDRKFLGRAKALRLKLKDIDLQKVSLSPLYLANICIRWEIPVQEFVNPLVEPKPLIQKPHELLKLLVKNPNYLRSPILIHANVFHFLDTFSVLEDLDLYADSSNKISLPFNFTKTIPQNTSALQ